MGNSHQPSITPAEVLAVSDGIDEATGQPIVCLTIRRLDGTGWACENYSLSVENGRSLNERLTWALEPSASANDEQAGRCRQDGAGAGFGCLTSG